MHEDRRDELIAATLDAPRITPDLIGKIVGDRPASRTDSLISALSNLGGEGGKLLNALARRFIREVGPKAANTQPRCYDCPAVGACMLTGRAQSIYLQKTAPELPEPGAVTQVVHFRLWVKVKSGETPLSDEYVRSPWGGLTLTFLAHPKEGRETVWYMGPAACSVDDRYDRNLGAQMSLRRALLVRHALDSAYRFEADAQDHETARQIAADFVDRETVSQRGERGYLRDWDRKIGAAAGARKIVLAAWDAVISEADTTRDAVVGEDNPDYDNKAFMLDPKWFVRTWELNSGDG
jgi:hypothetical protein